MESSKVYFLKLSIVFWLIFFILLFFLVITIWLIKPDREDDYDLHYLVTDVLVMLIGFYCAYYYPNKRIRRAKRKNGIHDKLVRYRTAMMIRWIIIAFVALYSIFSFIMTREYFFICTTLFSLGVLIVTKSSRGVLSDHLSLTSKERSVIYTPDAAV